MKPFHEWCGPQALACALDIDAKDAATRIRFFEPDAKTFCDIDSIAGALGKRVHCTMDLSGAGFYRKPYRWVGVPTLARFLREHPVGSYILRTVAYKSGHFINVYDGEVIQDNGMHGRRHRVTHYINLEEA